MKARNLTILILATGLVTAGMAFLLRKLGDDEHPAAPRVEHPPEKKPPDSTDPGHRNPDRTDPVASRGGTVRVYVYAAGVAVEAAHVTLFRGERLMHGKTGADGGWVSAEIPAGEWEVGVRHDLYMPAHDHAVVREATEASVAIELKVGAKATGQVVDARRQPIAGVQVSVRNPDTLMPTGFGLETRTGADGRYVLDGIPPGSIALWFVSSSHRPARSDLTFTRAGEIQQADVQLADANFLGGRVEDEDGVAIAGAQVSAWNELGSVAKTDAEGKFLIQRLGDAPVQLSVRKDGYGTMIVRGLTPNRMDVRVRMPKGGAIVGRIAGPDKCEVKIWRYDEDYRKEIMIRGFQHDPTSRPFRVEDFPPGSYTLTAESEGWQLEAPVTVTVERGRTAEAAPLRLRRK